MGGPGGGPGGGGRMAPVSAKATAAEIFPQKCAGCHGEKGEGKMGPNLTHLASASDEGLYATIQNGNGRMPAFGRQMTEAQIKELVGYVKKLEAR